METRMLPVGNFKWVPKKEIKTWATEDILNLPSQSRIGYDFEVDLHYPKKYHEINNFFVKHQQVEKKFYFICREMINFLWLLTPTR